MKIYCTSCGHGVAYTSEKPNFCQKCGKGFAGAVASVSAQPTPELDASVEGESVPQLDGLDFEIIPEQSSKVTMEQIFADAARQETAPQADGVDDYQGEFSSAAEAVEELKREGGTLRPKNPDG